MLQSIYEYFRINAVRLAFDFEWISMFVVPITASIQDVKRGKVNNFFLWGATLLMIVCQAILFDWKAKVWVYIVQGIFLALIFLLARILTKGKLGLADVYFAGFVGVSLDFNLNADFVYLYCFIIFSCAAALIFYIVAFLIKLISKKKICGSKIPFIPFLSIGFFFAKMSELSPMV